ncbi:MAG: cell division/cell wall cluster transcriptional repressor MraZ [Actinomycetota bacterium]|nr:cell division/cell wall cluster transcriptional repressor MraZ [Actinomycetota bacterium]
MAPRFFGRYEHSLDAKGRVILPARFRAQFGPQAYVSQFQDRCLALWTSDEFEKQMTDQEQRQDQGRIERNVARVWASGSAEVDIDRQGRFAIPGHLRVFARLEVESPILVNGALNRVELWNPAEWELRVKPAEAQLTDEYDEPAAPAEAP